MGKQTELLEEFFASKDAKKVLKPKKSAASKAAKKTSVQTEAGGETHLTLQKEDFSDDNDTKQKTISKQNPSKTALFQKKTSTYIPKDISSQLQITRSKLVTGKRTEAEGSPLQLNLIQSESLRLAQNKIASLEEELESQRRDNEKLIAAAEVLEERMDHLRAENEELRREKRAYIQDFSNEKEVLMATLEEGRKKTAKLEKIKTQLEKRLSRDLQSIRARENSLENRIEIMKLENGVLQKEKDKLIIDLRRDIYKIQGNLKMFQKKNQELKSQLNQGRESLRKTVSVLRATVNNLEGAEPLAEQTDSIKKAI